MGKKTTYIRKPPPEYSRSKRTGAHDTITHARASLGLLLSYPYPVVLSTTDLSFLSFSFFELLNGGCAGRARGGRGGQRRAGGGQGGVGRGGAFAGGELSSELERLDGDGDGDGDGGGGGGGGGGGMCTGYTTGKHTGNGGVGGLFSYFLFFSDKSLALKNVYTVLFAAPYVVVNRREVAEDSRFRASASSPSGRISFVARLPAALNLDLLPPVPPRDRIPPPTPLRRRPLL